MHRLTKSLYQEEHLSQTIRSHSSEISPRPGASNWGGKWGAAWRHGQLDQVVVDTPNTVLTPNCGSLTRSLMPLGRAPVFINFRSRLKDGAVVNYCQDRSRRMLSFLFSRLLNKLVKDGFFLSRVLPSTSRLQVHRNHSAECLDHSMAL